jgi:hypothetical protein
LRFIKASHTVVHHLLTTFLVLSMKLIKSSNPLPVATIVLLTLFLTGCGALKITDSTASVTLHKVIRATRNAPIVVIKEREGGSILIESVDKRAGFLP